MTNTSKKKTEKGDELAKTIGNRILKARTGLNWSQETLHAKTKMSDPEKIGISRAVLSLYERGVNKPGSREITLLCQALHISPNWLLLGSESPAKTLQPSVVFLQGDQLSTSVRLAIAIMTLDSSTRDALSNLILSMLNKKYEDYEISSLMYIAREVSDGLYSKILKEAEVSDSNTSIEELIKKFTHQASQAIYTNAGTLRPLISEEDLDSFDPNHPPPPRSLDQE